MGNIKIIKIESDNISDINKQRINKFKKSNYLYDFIQQRFVRKNIHKASNNKHKEIFSTLLKEFKNKKILDAACGTGASMTYIDSKNYYSGIDLSYEMLKKAVRKADKKVFLKASFYEGNCEKLNFKNQHFDIVIMDTALHMVEKYKDALKEMVRVLKPGGRLFCSFPCMGILDEFDKNWVEIAKERNLNSITEDEVKSVCKSLSVDYKKEAINGAVLYFSAHKVIIE